MRKRRFRGQSDSLDLLLDTICNTFGGIIFIACLVTLLARETDSGPNRAMEQADVDMLKRRIDVATSDLARLEALVAEQTESRASVSTLAKRRDELTAVITEMRAKAAEAGKEAAIQPPAGELQRLRAGNRPLRNEIERLLNAVTSSEKEIARLESRQKELARKTADTKTKNRENLRFPKEGKQEKTPFWLIVKHGKIYPVRGDNGDLNNATLVWESKGSQGDEVTPRPASGAVLPADAENIAAQLRAVAAGRQYLTVCLFPDSYDTWRDLRRIAQTAGLEYGLKFFGQNDQLFMSQGGSAPPPL